MNTATTLDPVAEVDPGSRTAYSWVGQRNGLIGRGEPMDDPRIVAAGEALAYWRVRNVIDANRDALNPAHIPALADLLRHAHALPGGRR